VDPSRGQRWVEVLDRRDDLKAAAEALLVDLEPKAEPSGPFEGRGDSEYLILKRDLNPRPADYESDQPPVQSDSRDES